MCICLQSFFIFISFGLEIILTKLNEFDGNDTDNVKAIYYLHTIKINKESVQSYCEHTKQYAVSLHNVEKLTLSIEVTLLL